MGKSEPAAVIAQLAVANHNVVTREQLTDAGLTKHQIDGRIKDKLLVPLHRGVYLLGGGRASFRARTLAAAWACGGYASHLCAAKLFGLRRIECDTVEITVAGQRASTLPGISCHAATKLAAHERATIDRIPVTSPARILLDIVDVTDPKIFEGVLDDVLVRKVTSLATIDRMLRATDGRGREAIGFFRELVAQRLAGRRPTESPLEDDLINLIRRFGLPEPERQYWITAPNGKRIRLDGAYPDRLLDVEADSRRYHSSLSSRRADEERDRQCEAAGWTVRRFTTEMIRRRPGDVAVTIAESLGVELAA